ncbi:MAG: hypothetical protein N2053_02095 [Chitinispirillaceae bacterium]|nr:hypothetical protein [Chitinispirillaceae bacterium]
MRKFIYDQDIEDINPIDFSIVMGGGIKIRVGNTQHFVVTDIIYTRGLVNIIEGTHSSNIKNRILSFTLGFEF